MIRVQSVLLPLLKSALPGTSVVSVVPDIDYRSFPLVAVKRSGGVRNRNLPTGYARPVVELQAVSADGLIEAEELYEDALEALYAAVRAQTVVGSVGYLQSITEAQGATQTESPYPDTWSVSGSVEVGLRSSV